MNEDAFARRFYADRSELEALRIVLSVEKPVDGQVEQETYSLAPENFHLPAIEFTDQELAAPAHGAAAARRRVRVRRAAAAGAPADLVGPPESAHLAGAAHGRARDHGLGGRPRGLASAWPRSRPRSSGARRSCSTTTRWSATSWGRARVDPYQLLYQGGQFYLVGRSHERDAIRVFRLSRIRGKVGYATKAEHDFQRPAGLRSPRLRQPDRLAVRRSGRRGRGVDRPADRAGRSSATSAATARCAPTSDDGDRVFTTPLRERAAADRLGARPRRERADPRARRSSPPSSRDRARAADRAPHRRARSSRRDAPSARRRPPRTPRPTTRDRRRQRPPPRRRDPPRAVRAAGDAREHPDRRRPRRAAPRRRGAAQSRSRSQTRSCARTSRC